MAIDSTSKAHTKDDSTPKAHTIDFTISFFKYLIAYPLFAQNSTVQRNGKWE